MRRGNNYSGARRAFSQRGTVTRTRQSIGSQLQERFAELGLAYEVTSDGGPIRYHVAGEILTPGEAADKYLPGGFAANYGKA